MTSSTSYPISTNRLATFKYKIKNLPIIGPYTLATWNVLKLIIHFYLVRKIFKLLDKVEYYQPIYNLSGLINKQPKRGCLDRADAIYQQIQSWGQGGRILDVGCSLGYFSSYFAKRGHLVHAMDTSHINIRICKLAQKINDTDIDYTMDEFSSDFINKMTENQYDIAFLFSVVHHIINLNGLEYAQDLMVKLLDKVPVLFVELALKHEHTSFPWKEKLPEQELAIFSKCTDITIKKIGVFPTHISDVWRPLYMVSKNTITACNHKLKINSRRFSAHHGKDYGRHFYHCDQYFLKRYFIRPEYTLNFPEISQEIVNYQKLPQNDYFPRLIAHQNHNSTMDVLFSELPGENIHKILTQEKPVPILSIIHDVIKGLSFLLKNGLYHNDIRPWNIMFDGKKARLLDLGLASETEIENTTIAILWLISQMQSYFYYEFPYPLTSYPEINLDQSDLELKEIVQQLKNTDRFDTFLVWYNERYCD